MKRFSCFCLALALVAALGGSPAAAVVMEQEEADVNCRRVSFFTDEKNLSV